MFEFAYLERHAQPLIGEASAHDYRMGPVRLGGELGRFFAFAPVF